MDYQRKTATDKTVRVALSIFIVAPGWPFEPYNFSLFLLIAAIRTASETSSLHAASRVAVTMPSRLSDSLTTVRGEKDCAMKAFFRYQVFLLRMWQETPTSEWRISLQSGKTGKSHLFANLDEAARFLAQSQETDDDTPPSDVTLPSR